MVSLGSESLAVFDLSINQRHNNFMGPTPPAALPVSTTHSHVHPSLLKYPSTFLVFILFSLRSFSSGSYGCTNRVSKAATSGGCYS